jgi:hypothetical protein
MKIGDPIWYFDLNRRRYTKDSANHFGKLIWREHWEPLKVLGETRVSWLVGFDKYPHHKVSKRDLAAGKLAGKWACSSKEVDDQVWVHENRYQISEAVGRVRDRDQLARIAAIIGYVEVEPPRLST